MEYPEYPGTDPCSPEPPPVRTVLTVAGIILAAALIVGALFVVGYVMLFVFALDNLRS